MSEDGLKMIMNEDGVFEKYNDEYDLTIHFESREEQDAFIKNAQTAVTREKIEQIKNDALYDIYMSGVNMTGEYQGCWVRFKDIENIVNEHFSGGLDKNSQKLELQEQEPKPMVAIDLYSVIKQKYIEREVLDKIRAEIEEQKKERCFDDNDMFVYRTGLDDALYIIDKYKAGKEET